MERQGQRLLLALSPRDEAEEYSSKFSFVGILAAIGGMMCLIIVVFMCTCKNSSRKDENDELEHQQTSKKGDKKHMMQVTPDGADHKCKADVEVVVVNGGSSTLPGHSRQASSGSAHMRPTSLRELPAPPVSTHHTPNKALCGTEPATSSVKVGGGGGVTTGAAGGDYAYHQHAHHPRSNKNVTTIVTSDKGKDQSQSDGYDHLGVKPRIKPTDYDSLAEPQSTDGETPLSESSGLDGHYSQLRERTYAVVGDVKAKAKELFDPYSKVKDKDDASSDYYSQVKEEDPYNHISDSGGNVTLSFIRRLRQSRDIDDPYATVQDSAEGDLKSSLPHNTSSGRISSTSSTQQDDGDVEEEYAVVQKAKGMTELAAEQEEQVYNDSDISPYSMAPPEPPRLYNDYDSAQDTFSSVVSASYKREHKYSKVTARESLASMSARNALNPYEVVMDMPENTYATVEGGSGDGVVLRAGATGGTADKRLSQSSDTYAEIGISGGGLSSSIISSSSSNNNSSISAAPVPPSLDSLHLMTKSQTSSEGDRHLASPEDSGMSLNLWADIHDDEDSEDGYSTLKKLESSPLNSSLPTIPDSSLIIDEESGEVTLVPNYQTVKDCISDNESMEETENDPNYESVDETRAKVALLKARNASSLDSRTSAFNSSIGGNSHLNVVKALNLSSGMGADSMGSKDEGRQRRRTLDHDYEEVDISPPLSPASPPSSLNHASSSSYHMTSLTTTTVSSHLVTEAVLGVTDARERVIQSHMYEELREVRAKTSEMSRVKKGNPQVNNSSSDKRKNGSNDRKKVEDKVKSSSEDKRKSSSEDKRKNVGEDRKKGSNEEKRKDDKKKGGSAVVNGTRL